MSEYQTQLPWKQIQGTGAVKKVCVCNIEIFYYK